MRTNTYVYVYINGKALGFTDDWVDTSGTGKDFITFGGEDFFACEAWKFTSADTAEEAATLLTEWLATKGIYAGNPVVHSGELPSMPDPRGSWTKGKVMDLVVETLREMGVPEEDLNGEGIQRSVIRYPLSVDFDHHDGPNGPMHGEHYFPVLGSMTEVDVRGRVREWAHSLRGHWKEEGPISAYGQRMAEKFPATYRAFMAARYGK